MNALRNVAIAELRERLEMAQVEAIHARRSRDRVTAAEEAEAIRKELALRDAETLAQRRHALGQPQA